MNFLTRRGARAVTTDLDRMANLFQVRHDDLGIPAEYAVKFAYYCDVLSDAVEKHAIKMAEEADKDEEKVEDEGDPKGKEATAVKAEEEKKDEAEKAEEEKKEASRKASLRKASNKKAEEEKKVEEKKDEEKEAAKKAALSKKSDDETGLSVDHGTSGFDANVIADEVSGPLEIIQPPSEPWMNDFFMQGEFQELRELTESGAMGSAAARGQILTKAAAVSMARLRRLASSTKLAQVEATLVGLHSKLPAGASVGVKLASNIQKQIVAVRKVRSAFNAGAATPTMLNAADRIVSAVAEQVPYLQQIAAGADAGAPLNDLVSYGTSIVVEAASAVKAGEMPDFIKEKVEEKDEKKDEKKEASAEDEKEEEKDEAKEASVKQAEEEEEKDEETDEVEKSASDTFGYNLFAN